METLFGNAEYPFCLRAPRPYFNRIEWFNGQLSLRLPHRVRSGLGSSGVAGKGRNNLAKMRCIEAAILARVHYNLEFISLMAKTKHIVAKRNTRVVKASPLPGSYRVSAHPP
jgi:hypothetical protein